MVHLHSSHKRPHYLITFIVKITSEKNKSHLYNVTNEKYKKIRLNNDKLRKNNDIENESQKHENKIFSTK